jgi:choline-sulfatase
MRVIYFDLDSTRPDHLSCYGYPRQTSPNVDRIAADGVRFTNVYCSDAPCMPSRSAYMSGRLGIQSGIVGHDGTSAQMKTWLAAQRDFRDPLDRDSLPARYRQAGMKTVLFSPFGERHSAYAFYAGFQEIHNTGKGGMESAEEVTPGILDWLDRHGKDENWYLHINYWDPHTPFRVPLEEGTPFADAPPLSDWLTEEVFEGHLRKTGPHSARDLSMYGDQPPAGYPRMLGALRTYADLRRHIDEYDTAVRYTDQHVGRVLAWLDQAGLYEDTVIIVSADHAENQGELGIYSEHATADEGTCHIPLIVKWPGGRAGAVDTDLHYHLDWLPTFAELAGQAAAAMWDGQSFAGALLRGESQGRDALVIGQLAHMAQRSVRWKDFLYIRTYFDGFHLFPKHMLFDLATDPYEQHNLAETSPELLHEAVSLLADWHDEQVPRLSDGIDPLWHVLREFPRHARPSVHLPAYLKHLDATGRADGAAILRARYPGIGDSS